MFKLLTVKRDGILQSLGRISYNMDKVGICCECEFKEKEGSMVGVDIVVYFILLRRITNQNNA